MHHRRIAAGSAAMLTALALSATAGAAGQSSAGAPAESGPGVVPPATSTTGITTKGLPCSKPGSPYQNRSVHTTYSRPGMYVHRWTALDRTRLFLLKAKTVGRPRVKFGPIAGQALNSRATSTQRLGHTRYGLVATNADFFYWGQTWTAWGPEVLNGTTRKGSFVAQDALVGYRDGHVGLAKVKMNEIIWANGKVLALNTMNSQNLAADGIGMYGAMWGNTPMSYVISSGRVEEIFVANNRITAISQRFTTQARPTNGYVLVAQGRGVDRLNALKPRIGLRLGKMMQPATTSTGRTVYEALGVGLILIRNGILQANAACVSDRQVARTIVGIADGGTTLYVAVCEGIKDNSYYGHAGLSLREATGVMRELGVSDAMMFDGGGSTQLSVRDWARTWQVARPADGYQRPVPSMLGIFSQ
ncbi:MAG: phosphodiester glycosidase family protein [Mycobacteriales bacterium]